MDDIKSAISIDDASWFLKIAEAKFKYHFGDMRSQVFLIHEFHGKGALCFEITNENGQLVIQNLESRISGTDSAHTRRVTCFEIDR